MKERKEEINLGLREYLCFANIIEISLFILFIFVYHVCDFFLSKYINSLSQTLKLSDQACSTPSLKLGCMKTVFKNLEDQIFCQNNEWHFPKYSVEHQYVQIPVGPLPVLHLCKKQVFQLLHCGAVWPVYPATKTQEKKMNSKHGRMKTSITTAMKAPF